MVYKDKRQTITISVQYCQNLNQFAHHFHPELNELLVEKLAIAKCGLFYAESEISMHIKIF